MKRVFAFIGFSIAITLILLNVLDFGASKYLLILAAVLFVISLAVKRIRQATVVPIVFGCAVFACFIFIFVNANTVLPQQSLDGEYLTASFRIVDIPSKTQNGYSYIVKTEKIEKTGTVQNIRLRVKSKVKIQADYYDLITGNLSFHKIADNAFESYGYFSDGIFMTSSAENCTVEKSDNKPLHYYVIKCREYIKEILSTNLDSGCAGLSIALLIGDKDSISSQSINDFNISGTAHIMAVSGLHTTVICYGFYSILKRLGVPVELRVGFTGALILFYIGLADFSKSVIRAGIMLAVMIFAEMFRFKADALNSLGFSVFVICLNPFAVSDAGAMLTVCSVLGITVIYPELNKYCPGNKILSYFYKSFSASLAVLASTLPAMWLFFKCVTVVGLFLNFIIIPLAQSAMILSLSLVLFHRIGFLTVILKHLCTAFLKAIMLTAHFGAQRLSFGYRNICGAFFAVAIAVIFLFLGISLLAVKTVNTKITALFIAVVFAVSSAMASYTFSNSIYLHLSYNGGIILYSRDKLAVIDNDYSYDYDLFKNIINMDTIDKALLINSSDAYVQLCDMYDVESVSYNGTDNFNVDLSDHIIVQCNSGNITLTIYDSFVTVSDDYVTVGDYAALRNVYGRFSDETNITMTFAQNAQVIVRKESLWLN